MNLKKLNLTVLLVTILVLVPTIQIVYASPLSTFYLSGGIYPHGVSYTLWKEGSYYYAKNAYGFQPSWSGSTNATETITNTLNLLINGGKVFFKGAEYLLNLQGVAGDKYGFQIQYSNIILTGEGSQTVFKLANAEAKNGTWDSIIRVGVLGQEKSGIVIENLKIDGNNPNQNGYGIKGILILGNTTFSTVQNCELVDINTWNYSYSGAIFGRTGSKWNTIKDNIILRSGASGIYLETCHHYIVSNNHIDGQYIGKGCGIFSGGLSIGGNNLFTDNIIENMADDHAMYISRDRNDTVIGNTLRNCGGHGIHIRGYGLVFENNIVCNNSDGGIFAQETFPDWGTNMVIDGNIVMDNGHDGINLYCHYYGLTVTNNIVFNNKYHGIDIGGGSRDTIIYGNVVYGNNVGNETNPSFGKPYAGIFIHQTFTCRLVVSNNIISNETEAGGGWQYNGIEVSTWDDKKHTDLIFEGNLIRNQQNDGILLHNIGNDTFFVISDNDITLCGEYGIFTKGNIGVISGNLIHNCSYGMYLWTTNNVSITGNTCVYNDEDGIYLDSSLYCTLTGNICGSNGDDGIETAASSDYNIIVANNLLGNSGTNLVTVGTNNVIDHNLS